MSTNDTANHDYDEVRAASRSLAAAATTLSSQCAALSRDRASVIPLENVVLVVHDTRPVGDALAHAIRDVAPCLDVEVAYTYFDALALARHRRPRLVVADWHLDNDHTGIELRRTLGVGPLALLVTAQDVDRRELARIARDVDARLCVLDASHGAIDKVAETVRELLGPMSH